MSMFKKNPTNIMQVKIPFRKTLSLEPLLFRFPELQNSSTCSADSWQRGNGQRVFSFAFYGNPKSSKHQSRGYFEGIRANLDAISSFYNRDWSVRLYHNIGSKNPLMDDLCSLACANDRLDLCPVNQQPHPLLANAVHMFPMIWRFFPTLDSQVDVFMSRDLDSVVKLREVEAVEEWLESGKTLHVMRDHPQHTAHMLGGLWGAQTTLRRQVWRDLWKGIWTDIIADPVSRTKRSRKGPDQALLTLHVWGRLPGGDMQHDSFSCAQYPGAVGFPSQRPNSSGNVVGGGTLRKQENIECPTQCRRKQSWTFC